MDPEQLTLIPSGDILSVQRAADGILIAEVHLPGLTDEAWLALADAIWSEAHRRWPSHQPVSFATEIRQSLQHPTYCSCGYGWGHPGPCQALF